MTATHFKPASRRAVPLRGWFAKVPPDVRRDLLALGQFRSHSAGAVIYRAGDSGKDVFAVASGVVVLESRFTHPDAVALHLLHPGDWFGTVPVLVNRARRVTATARSAVEVLCVPGAPLRALLQQRPDVAFELGRDLVHHLDMALQMAADLLIRNTSARCAAVLLRLGGRRWTEDREADLPADVPATQAEIAMLANVSRNTLNEVLREFAARGLTATQYRSVLLKDPAGLRRIADGG